MLSNVAYLIADLIYTLFFPYPILSSLTYLKLSKCPLYMESTDNVQIEESNPFFSMEK